MDLKTRLVLMSATGLLSVSAIAGYGTYALFTAQTQNTNNSFTAGTLAITSERQDVPQAGPMFYSSTTNTSGVMPTGLWAPGDKHTRGLFLENTGSLTGRLMTLSAIPADASGTPLSSTSSSDQYYNDILFASQSDVVIWQLVAYNQSDNQEGQIESSQMTASQFESYVDNVNQSFQALLPQYPNALSDPVEKQQLLNEINQKLLQVINNVTATQANGTIVTNDSLQVIQMTSQHLNDLVKTPQDVSSLNVTVSPKSSVLLAFTVGMDLNPPTGVDPNSMQGKSVYFNFGTNWIQTRSNPLVPIVPGMAIGTVYTDNEVMSNGAGPASSGIWNTPNAQSGGAANGVPLIFSTNVNIPTGSSGMTIKFNTDDVSELYVDGIPMWLQASWNQNQTVSLNNLAPGQHTVQFFAENTVGQNPVSSSPPNYAVLNAAVYDANNNMLVTTATPNRWTVQQPKAGESNFDPYMFGGSIQPKSGIFVPGDVAYGSATSGIPIGPATLPQ